MAACARLRRSPRAALTVRLPGLQPTGKRTTWLEADYEALLTSHGFSAAPAEAGAWRWCAPRGAEAAGVGGYTCGLWLLFHATLANSDRFSAAEALQARPLAPALAQ